MKHLITGVAGFIGSNLAKEFLSRGKKAIGVDCFTDYYSRSLKEKNIEDIMEEENFRLIEGDLLKLDLDKMLTGVDYIYHQAAPAGVGASWGESFSIYTNNNTKHQLLQARYL